MAHSPSGGGGGESGANAPNATPPPAYGLFLFSNYSRPYNTFNNTIICLGLPVDINIINVLTNSYV